MTAAEMITKIDELKELEALIAEAKAEAESITDELKAEMDNEGVEHLDCGKYVIHFTSVLSSRFDQKAFKEKMGADMFALFTKQVSSKRFSIA